jgi:DnaJ-class molecular chaperone
MEKLAKKKDYYKVLGLDKTANENQIRKAYKVLALKWHPDKNNQSESQKELADKKFKEISEAYDVLSDPKKKQMFDNGMDPNDPESGGGFSSGGGVNPHDIFSMFFGGGGSPFGDDDGFGGGHPFSHFSTGGNSSKGGARTFTFKFG